MILMSVKKLIDECFWLLVSITLIYMIIYSDDLHEHYNSVSLCMFDCQTMMRDSIDRYTYDDSILFYEKCDENNKLDYTNNCSFSVEYDKFHGYVNSLESDNDCYVE